MKVEDLIMFEKETEEYICIVDTIYAITDDYYGCLLPRKKAADDAILDKLYEILYDVDGLDVEKFRIVVYQTENCSGKLFKHINPPVVSIQVLAEDEDGGKPYWRCGRIQLQSMVCGILRAC